jgi:hypothetical protein
MQRVNFSANQIQVSQLLNLLNDIILQSKKEISEIFSRPGIIKEKDRIPFNLELTEPLKLRVGFGKAIINGKLIEISKEKVFDPDYANKKESSGNTQIPLNDYVNKGPCAVYVRHFFVKSLPYGDEVSEDGYEIVIKPVDEPMDGSFVYIGWIQYNTQKNAFEIDNDEATREEKWYLYIPSERLKLLEIINLVKEFFKGFSNGIISSRPNAFQTYIDIAENPQENSNVYVPQQNFLIPGEFLLMNGDLIYPEDLVTNPEDPNFSYKTEFERTEAAGEYIIYFEKETKKLKHILKESFSEINQRNIIKIAKIYKLASDLENGHWIITADKLVSEFWKNWLNTHGSLPPTTTPDPTINPYFPTDIRDLGLVNLSQISNRFLRNVDALPLSLNVIDYRDGSASFVISYYDPEDKIKEFVVEGFNSQEGIWEELTRIAK